MTKRPWGAWQKSILPHAAAIVASYGTTGVTLRQLFYRLVADGTIRNDKNEYGHLAKTSAQARRDGTFPDLIDTRNRIQRPSEFDSPQDGLDALIDSYRRDRTEGQPYSVYIGNEKMGQSAQLREWFGDRGIPVLTVGGWASTPFVKQVQEDIDRQGRPAILIYAGDLDPSGAYIGQEFADRVGKFTDVVRVGVNVDQIAALPANPTPDKVEDDPRAPRFVRDFGPALKVIGFNVLVQYELDALDPADLRDLYEEALAVYWDEDAYQRILTAEADDLAVLTAIKL